MVISNRSRSIPLTSRAFVESGISAEPGHRFPGDQKKWDDQGILLAASKVSARLSQVGKPRKRVDASADNDSWVKPTSDRLARRRLRDQLEFMELHRSGEEAVFSDGQLISMLELGKAEIRRLVEIQESIL